MHIHIAKNVSHADACEVRVCVYVCVCARAIVRACVHADWSRPASLFPDPRGGVSMG
jgi:hypothetical protein